MSLKLKPSYKAITDFFTNFDIVESFLKEYVRKKKRFDYFNVIDNVLESINDNHSHHLSNESSVSYLLKKLEIYKYKHPFYNLLHFLSSEHFEFIRGRNILRIDNIEVFQFLYNHMDINPIYSMAIVKSIQDLPYNEKFLYIKYKTNNSSLSYPKRFSFLEYFSDNHFHLGGANSFAHRLNSILQEPLSIDSSIMPQNREVILQNKKIDIKLVAYATSLLEKMIFTFILRDTQKSEKESKYFNHATIFQKQFLQFSKAILNFNIQSLQTIEKEYKINMEEHIKKDEKKIYFSPPLITIRPKTKTQGIIFYSKDNYYTNLIFKIIKNNKRGNLQKADKILLILLCEILKTHENRLLQDAIYVYIVFRNIIHNTIVQQQKEGGLSYFSSYSRSTVRRAKKDSEFIETFRSVFYPNSKMNIEGRINFQDKSYKYAEEMEKWLKAFFVVSNEQDKRCIENDSLNFLFHFKKNGDSTNKNLKGNRYYYIKSRHNELRLQLFKQAKAFLNFMKSKKYRKYTITLERKDFDGDRFLKDFDCVEEKARKVGYELLSEKDKDILVNKKHIFRHEGILNKKCKNGKAIQYEVDLRKFVAGIDAASKEYNSPPEVFAPIYSFIRNSIELSNIPFDHSLPVASTTHCSTKLFQFSYHVGEEFKDILSGIRHIVETAVFLGFRKGDRLGHALALGLNPEKFVMKNRVIISSIEEQFNNAVFGYFILDRFSEDSRLKNIYYQKAMKYGSYIYRSDYEIDNYINAWLLRRNSPINLRIFLDKYFKLSKIDIQNSNIKGSDILKKEAEICAYSAENSFETEYLIKYYYNLHESSLFFKHSLPDLFKLKLKDDDKIYKRYEWARRDLKAWELFIKYHFYSKIRDRGKEEIDVLSLEAKDIELIQDIVMQEVIAKRDIVIEVMPTSNVLNSVIESYEEHPMFRFKPVENLNEFNNFGVRKTPLRVIINTDNPGFQATSYINELFLISQAGLKRGYSNEKMEKYLEEIITLGNMLYSGKASQE